jgi:hypothetical protein
VRSGRRAAVQVLDELRPQSLTASDYSLLEEVSAPKKKKEEVVAVAKKQQQQGWIYRWTLALPAVGLAVGYAAYALRDRYCGLFVPMGH